MTSCALHHSVNILEACVNAVSESKQIDPKDFDYNITVGKQEMKDSLLTLSLHSSLIDENKEFAFVSYLLENTNIDVNYKNKNGKWEKELLYP